MNDWPELYKRPCDCASPALQALLVKPGAVMVPTRRLEPLVLEVRQ